MALSARLTEKHQLATCVGICSETGTMSTTSTPSHLQPGFGFGCGLGFGFGFGLALGLGLGFGFGLESGSGLGLGLADDRQQLAHLSPGWSDHGASSSTGRRQSERVSSIWLGLGLGLGLSLGLGLGLGSNLADERDRGEPEEARPAEDVPLVLDYLPQHIRVEQRGHPLLGDG